MDLELRRQLRALQKDAEVPPMLWSGIEARIGASPAAITKQGRGPVRAWMQRWPRTAVFAVAAAAVLAVALPLHQLTITPSNPGHSPDAPLVAGAPSRSPSPSGDAHPTDTELSAALSRNPVLAATDAELRAVERALERAHDTDPDSALVERMLARTRAERRRLLQYQSQLG